MQLDYFDSRTELIWETARRLTKYKNQTSVKNDLIYSLGRVMDTREEVLILLVLLQPVPEFR